MARGTELGNLFYSLGIESDQYNKGFAAAEKLAAQKTVAIEGYAAKIERAFGIAARGINVTKTALGALGAGAALGALNRLATSALSAADALQDASDRLGLSAEALQEFRFAGQQAGIAVEQVDQALAVFSRNVAEAAQGQGELAKVAKAHNIALKDTQGNLLATDVVLERFADVIKDAGSAQERLRLSQAAFGREGTKFVNVLQGGAAGLARASAEARAFGAVLDNDLVAKGARAADQIDAIKAGLLTAFQRGTLEGVTGGIDDVSSAIERLGPVVEDLGRATADGFEMAAEAAAFLTRHLEVVEAGFLAMQGLKIGGYFGRWGAAVGMVAGALLSLHDEIHEGLSATRAAEVAIDDYAAAQRRAARSADEMTAAEARRARATVEAELARNVARVTEARNFLAGTNANIAARGPRFAATDVAARAQAAAEAALNTAVAETRGNILRLTMALQDNIVVTGVRRRETLKAAEAQRSETEAEDDAIVVKGRSNKESREGFELRQRQLAAGEKTLQAMKDEIEVLAVLRAAGAEEAEVTETRLRLRRELGPVYDENADAFDAMTRAMIKARKETAALDDAQKQAAEAAAAAAEDVARVWDEAARDMFDAWRDGWRDLLAGKVKDFDDFARKILNIGLDLAANMIAAQTWQAAFGGALSGGAAAGRGSQSGGSLVQGFGGLTGGLTQGSEWLAVNSGLLTGSSNVANAMYRLSSPAGLAGGFAGGLAANAVFGRGTGTTVGSTLGAVAGSFIPIPGVGTAIGSFLGGAAGSLFNGRPSDRTEAAVYNVQSGRVTDSWNLGPNKADAENRQAVDTFVAAVQALQTLLQSRTGGRIAVDEIDYRVGDRDGMFLRVGARTERPGTAADAFRVVIEEFVAHLEGAAPRVQRALQRIDFGDLERAGQQLDVVLAFEQAIREFTEVAKPAPTLLAQIKANFAALIEQMDDFGYTADEILGLQAQAIAKARAEVDSFNADELQQLVDPLGHALAQLDKEFAGRRTTVRDLGGDLVTLEKIYAERRREILRRLGPEIAAIEEQVEDATADIAAAWDRVASAAREALDARLDGLADERAAIEDTRQAAAGLLNGVRSAKLRLTTDPKLALVSNEESLRRLLARLDETAARAKGGDRDAQGELAELALAAQEANVVFNASSEAGARIQEHILGLLDDAESTATAQLRVAELNLAANQAQVALLQAQLNAIAGGGPGAAAAAATSAKDLDALNAAYAFAGAPAPGSALFGAFESELLKAIDRLPDTARLLSDLGFHQGRAGDSVFGASSGRVAEAIRAQLHDLNVPGFAAGGMTGRAAYVHPGELLWTGPPARVFNRAESATVMAGDGGALAAEIRTLARTVSIANEDQLAVLTQMSARLGRLEQNASLARALS